MLKDLFEKVSKAPENGENNGKPKPPVNIFSKPVNVLQTEEARRERLKVVIIEGLLFGAFLTAITAIYAISGIELKVNPTAEANTPSLFYFLLEFVIFSLAAGAGDYFMTEKRVNEYNQKVAGLSFNIDDEIEKALKEQAEDGISESEASALNKSNGEETSSAQPLEIEVRGIDTVAENGAVKVFEAFASSAPAGKAECCKAVLLDTHGMEYIILRISVLDVSEGLPINDVAAKIFEAAKDFAVTDGYSAVIVPASLNDKFALGLSDTDKFNVVIEPGDEIFKMCEVYPGALMGVSGKVIYK